MCVPGTSVSPADYTIVGLLGDGALGRVYLCDIPDGTSCALKVMSKADIAARNIAETLAMEREILLRSVGHPFVAQIFATFSTGTFEYMVMELAEGSLFDALYTARIPAFKGRKAQARVARYASLHPTAIDQKVEVIVEHFRRHVAKELSILRLPTRNHKQP